MEALEFEGVATIPFMYPYNRDRSFLSLQIAELERDFGVSRADVERSKQRLEGIRDKIRTIDRLTWQDGVVTGLENHIYHITCSDMKGDPGVFEREIDDFIQVLRHRKSRDFDIRLGYVGIPPIVSGIYEYIESQGGGVVFNELQRQFSMPHGLDDIVDQYLAYTYPYHIRFRLEDIKAEIRRRRIDGLVHYVQAFCFRQVEDIIIRRQIGIPVLTIEGNRPGRIDLRTKVRIEAFLDMVRSLKARWIMGSRH
jgi:benzoyl-CoA reductase/2-hydroxyglutaryl-CoA dehydratase subunit BcrC/BadD/HgdB